ncbi:MAG: DNA-binding protein [Polyangiaceae bacterium]|nr:DNA-binding protein [Polyangiaceae bacterium]
MNDINQQLRARIESFVGEIAELVRQATLESVYATLGAVETRARTSNRGAGRGRAAATFPVAAAGRRGGKRSADELVAMSGEILNHVRQNPGQGVEQISAALGISSKELTLPIRKLVGQGELKTEGQKRATKYFTGGARGGSRAGAAPARASRAPAPEPATKAPVRRGAKAKPAPAKKKKKSRGR